MEAERTILFADVCDSTGMTEALGNVRARAHIAEILEDLTSATQSHGGTVIKTIGDEIMSSFTAPIDGINAAADMQRAMGDRTPIGRVHSKIRVGVHGGRVLLERGDVFGDVVNVSARLVGLAAPQQVLTTASTIAAAGEDRVPHRSLGVHDVRGRDERLHLCEILWRGETAQMTSLAPKFEPLPKAMLEIRFRDEIRSLEGESRETVSIGRGVECTLVVPSASASRAHAEILSRAGLFYLNDHSTNGTYVKPEGGSEIFVHRGQIQLQGSGLIRLGERVTEAGQLGIEYDTQYEDAAG